MIKEMDILTNKGYRQIKGYPHYYISKNGDIFSIKKQKHLKQNKTGSYKSVVLCNDGKPKTHRIHRLVANAFIDNRNNKPCVNHINCDKYDNRVENLEWVSYKENMIHAIDNKLCRYGSKHQNSKLKEREVRLIRFLKGKLSHSDIAYCFNISRSVVTTILLGKAWKIC